MRTSHLAAGLVAGIALGLGGAVAADVATESADAQGSTTPAEAAQEARAASTRASAAIRKANTLNNNLGKYFVPNNVNIGANQPPGVITSDRGTGANGLPTETILNGAITNPKLGNESVNSQKIAPGGVTSGDLANNSVTSEKINAGAVTGEKIAAGAVSTDKIEDGAVSEAKVATGAVSTDKLAVGQKQYWAVVTGFPAAVTQSSHPNITANRVNAGNYRVNFAVDVSGCSANAVPYAEFGAGFPGAQTALIIRDNNVQQVQVRTLNPTSDTAPDAGQQVESNYMVQVLC